MVTAMGAKDAAESVHVFTAGPTAYQLVGVVTAPQGEDG